MHIVDPESLMLHAKFQDPRPLGSGDDDFLRFQIWTWSYDLD